MKNISKLDDKPTIFATLKAYGDTAPAKRTPADRRWFSFLFAYIIARGWLPELIHFSQK